MSRFNNPKALSTLAQPLRQPFLANGSTKADQSSIADPTSARRSGALGSVEIPPQQPNSLQRACFFTLCVYFLSGFANEFSSRLFHGKAYLSTVSVVLLPLIFLATGSALKGLEVRFGKWWLGFGVWLAICAPFSVWKSGTLRLLSNYYPRAFILYFVIAACIVTLSQLRTLMLLMGFSNFLVVLTCWKFGSNDGARFSVHGSIFSSFSNANELALQLLLGIIVLLFPFFRTGKLNKIISFCVIVPSVIYMLKTGSRGVLLGVVVTTLAFLVLTRKRMQALMVLVPLAALSLLMVSPETRHRLTYISFGDRIKVSSTSDESDLGSQLQREQLFKDSVRITLQHPIFGVGPGEFIVADSSEKTKAGDNAAWRQTHNSYTQVSSEAGLPGFVLYMGSMLLCLGMNFRLYRQTVGRKGLEEFAGLSFCMTLSMVAYAVCTVFDHLAYLTYLPTLGGITTATYFAAQPALASLRRQVR